MKSLYVVLILAAFTSVKSTQNALPVLMFAGLGDSCTINPTFNKLCERLSAHSTLPSGACHCVDDAPSLLSILFRSFHAQIDRACSIITSNAEKWGLENGFQAIGLSQGGLTARGVLQRCAYAQNRMKGLFTFGGPHQGVAVIPHTENYGIVTDAINAIIDRLANLNIAQRLVGPAGYFHESDNLALYGECRSEIAQLNNVCGQNPEYQDRINQLEIFVMVKFTEDTMIEPKETSHFGWYKDGSRGNEVVGFDSTPEFEGLNLHALKDANKIVFEECVGEHLQFGLSDFDTKVAPYLVLEQPQEAVEA